MPKKIEPITKLKYEGLLAGGREIARYLGVPGTTSLVDKLNELVSVVNQLIEKDEKETK